MERVIDRIIDGQATLDELRQENRERLLRCRMELMKITRRQKGLLKCGGTEIDNTANVTTVGTLR